MSEQDEPPLSENLGGLIAAQLDFAYNNPDAAVEELWENQALLNEAQIQDPRLHGNQLHFPDEQRDHADLSNEIAEAWVEDISEDEEDNVKDDVEDEDDLSFSCEQPKKRVKLRHDEDDTTVADSGYDGDSTIDTASRSMALVDRTRTTSSLNATFHANPSSNDRYARAGIATYNSALDRSRPKQSDAPSGSVAEGLRKLQLHLKRKNFDLPIRQAKVHSNPENEPSEDTDDSDGFELVTRPGSSIDSALSSPIGTRRSSDLELVQSFAEVPLLLQKLDDECLGFIVDLLYFPDAFALSMTCKAMNRNSLIDVKKKKAQYRSAVVSKFQMPQFAFCGVCLYMLPLYACFHAANCRCCVLEESQGHAEQEEVKICNDCIAFRRRTESAKRKQFDAEDVEDDWVVLADLDQFPKPVWRPHRKIPSRPGQFLWYRDPDWPCDEDDKEACTSTTPSESSFPRESVIRKDIEGLLRPKVRSGPCVVW